MILPKHWRIVAICLGVCTEQIYGLAVDSARKKLYYAVTFKGIVGEMALPRGETRTIISDTTFRPIRIVVDEQRR